MRWLMTGPVPDLVNALRAAGQEVVDDPALQFDAFFNPTWTAKDYPISDIAQNNKIDVVVVIEPCGLREVPAGLVETGIWRSYAQRLRQHRRQIVLFPQDDPETWRKFKSGQTPTCIARPQDAAAYLTAHPGARAEAAKRGRAVLWTGNADALVRAVEHARHGKTYLAKRDEGLFAT